MTDVRDRDLDEAADPAGFSRPAPRLHADWSAHVATTLDRLAQLLDELTPAEWEAPSLCEGWRVRDVVGHLIWRLGSSTPKLAISSLSHGTIAARPKSIGRTMTNIAREIADAPTEELVRQLRAVAAAKLRGEGRRDAFENVEAVVHTFDITEALGKDIRLSPRSTAAAVQARLRVSRKERRRAREVQFRATDARWVIGEGAVREGTAAEIVMDVYERRPLEHPSLKS